MSLKRQQIVDALRERLANIEPALNYHTDFADRAYLWHTSSFDVDELPAIDIRDTKNEPPDESLVGAFDEEYQVLTVEINVTCEGSTSDTIVRQMIADVKRAIGVDPTFGGLATNCIPQGDQMDLGQMEKKLGGSKITIGILYKTTLWQEE